MEHSAREVSDRYERQAEQARLLDFCMTYGFMGLYVMSRRIQESPRNLLVEAQIREAQRKGE